MTGERTLGVILGVCAGVLVDSCLIVLFSLLLIFMAPILFIPPAAGVVLGLQTARAGRLPSWGWPKMIFAGGVLLILAVVVPYFAAAGELRWQGRQIPVPPDSSAVQVRTGPLGSSMAGPSVTRIFETKADEEAVLSYYSGQLTRDGWQLLGDLENGSWFVRSGRHMFVRIAADGGRTLVTVTQNQDRVLAPWLLLLAVLVFATAVWARNRSM